MSLYQDKYRIESSRLKNWDYASNGYYFITICTKNKECLFGKITNGKMELSDVGEIVLREWHISFNIRKELSCDCFVIMPNHIHGIIIINNNSVETHGRASLRDHGIAFREPKSISSFVAGLKSSITKHINEYRILPGIPVWQQRFYDHVIRNNQDLRRIRKYIQNNPRNWKDNGFYRA